LKTRIITGIVFGAVLIGSIVGSVYSFSLLLLVVLVTGLFEYRRLLRNLDIDPEPVTTTLLNISCFGACILVPIAWEAGEMGRSEGFLLAMIFSFLVLAAMIAEIFRAKSKPLQNVASSIFSVFYLALPLGLLMDASIDQQGAYSWLQVLFFFLFMWASDTGAYFTGMAFGKHKLLERLSPKKTIEGFFGGLILSMLTGWAAYSFLGGQSLSGWILGGALLSCTGTLGDLFESMLKRQANIKDSGNILPGHGGVLDRFDSTFFSAPVYFFMIHAA
jgi:phosphatidate cytidylyltransferase